MWNSCQVLHGESHESRVLHCCGVYAERGSCGNPMPMRIRVECVGCGSNYEECHTCEYIYAHVGGVFPYARPALPASPLMTAVSAFTHPPRIGSFRPQMSPCHLTTE